MQNWRLRFGTCGVEKRVREFDEKVVFTDNAPDIDEYRAYYEQIAPENAERIYRQVLDRLQSSERAKELATLYAGMEPAAAAQMITNLNEELDLVCDILRNMKESNASAIMQELDSTYAAQITKKISTLGSN